MENATDRNVDHYADDHLHPRLTAKKTFFDLHCNRRRNGADEVAESEENFHPRIQWSAGTTDIGSGYQIGTYNDPVTSDIMKSVPRRQSSIPDEASIFAVSENYLPPLPDTWGSMDARPTQPEEIQHLLVPSPVIPTTENFTETEKRRKKFIKKFQKRSNPAVANSNFDSSRPLEDQVETVNPEEEFKLLNERYIREKIIPVESMTKESLDNSESSTRQMHFNSKKGKRFNRKGSLDTRCSHEKEMSPRTFADSIEKDRKSSNGKNVASGSNNFEYRSREESRISSLPARRSCEPLSVENLRKLRESEPKPGTSGIAQRSEYLMRSASEIYDAGFLSKSPKASIDDDEDEKGSEVFSVEFMKDETYNNDTFEIENPFSDFSLKNINRDKALLREHSLETVVNATARYHDLTQPGTSEAAHAMDAHRQKVSRTESVQQPEEKTREQSLAQSAVSRLRKTSLSHAMATNSERVLVANKESLISKSCSINRPQRRRTRSLGGCFLFAVLEKFGDQSFDLDNILSRDNWDNGGQENMIFHCYDHNLQHFLVPLMENIVNPTFDNFWNILPAPFWARYFYALNLMVKNSLWFEIMAFFRTTWPKAIVDVVSAWHVRKGNLPSMYSQVIGTGFDDVVSELAPTYDGRKTPSIVLMPDYVNSLTVVSNYSIDDITQGVVNIVTTQNLISEIRFLLSFCSMTTLIPGRPHYGNSGFSVLEKHLPMTSWPLFKQIIRTPIVFLLDHAFDFDESHSYEKFAIFERYSLSFIESTMTKLNYICLSKFSMKARILTVC